LHPGGGRAPPDLPTHTPLPSFTAQPPTETVTVTFTPTDTPIFTPTLTPSVTPLPTTDPNKIENPNFESDSGWKFVPGSEQITGEYTNTWKSEGSRSFKIALHGDSGCSHYFEPGQRSKIVESVDLTGIRQIYFDLNLLPERIFEEGGVAQMQVEVRIDTDVVYTFKDQPSGEQLNQIILLDPGKYKGPHLLGISLVIYSNFCAYGNNQTDVAAMYVDNIRFYQDEVVMPTRTPTAKNAPASVPGFQINLQTDLSNLENYTSTIIENGVERPLTLDDFGPNGKINQLEDASGLAPQFSVDAKCTLANAYGWGTNPNSTCIVCNPNQDMTDTSTHPFRTVFGYRLLGLNGQEGVIFTEYYRGYISDNRAEVRKLHLGTPFSYIINNPGKWNPILQGLKDGTLYLSPLYNISDGVEDSDPSHFSSMRQFRTIFGYDNNQVTELMIHFITHYIPTEDTQNTILPFKEMPWSW